MRMMRGRLEHMQCWTEMARNDKEQFGYELTEKTTGEERLSEEETSH